MNVIWKIISEINTSVRPGSAQKDLCTRSALNPGLAVVWGNPGSSGLQTMIIMASGFCVVFLDKLFHFRVVWVSVSKVMNIVDFASGNNKNAQG